MSKKDTNCETEKLREKLKELQRQNEELTHECHTLHTQLLDLNNDQINAKAHDP